MSKREKNLAVRVRRSALRRAGIDPRLVNSLKLIDIARAIAATLEPSDATRLLCRKTAAAFIVNYLRTTPMRPGERAERIAENAVIRAKRASYSVRVTFYDSPEWQRLRYRVLVNAKGSCMCCGATAKSSAAPLHVDHIKPRSRYPELELELSNLQVLCRACNLGKSAWDETDWREVIHI
jgi:5-methylcytosine-specific restriction endonuclease McrA